MRVNEKNTVDFAKLKPGDCFRYEGVLCIKTEFEQDAIVLDSGEVWSNMCGNNVIPINAEVYIID